MGFKEALANVTKKAGGKKKKPTSNGKGGCKGRNCGK